MAHIVPKNKDRQVDVAKILEEAADADDPDLDLVVRLAYDMTLKEFKQISGPLSVNKSQRFGAKKEQDEISDILGLSQKSDLQERPKSTGPPRRDVSATEKFKGSVGYRLLENSAWTYLE